MKGKSVALAQALSQEKLEKYNLEEKPESPRRSDETNTNTRSSRGSSVRWELDDRLRIEEDTVSMKLLRVQPPRQKNTRPSAVKFSIASIGDSMQRKSKLVGTNIPLSLERIIKDSVSSSMGNVNNSARDDGAMWPRGTPTRTSTTSSQRSTLPSIASSKARDAAKDKEASTRARPTAQGNQYAHIKGRHKSVAQDIDPPHSKFSQWTIKAELTATDVAGAEWLDYNDGLYEEPSEDCSLVSHGATIIMVRKAFMLKYLRKE
ncbi:hypothetical protein PoB_006965800 [Plakobranchus ocellatus]|uniref:Uncharacterized protein n=1 Tax=Plakobranchus ocellatus TaxID=259542 RepID=A0AAV4DFZ9_9GAST|nr:hypothetical protein PoB_006965800 [Plakobranchus ocellatus]